MLRLVRATDGWGLDYSDTTEAGEIQDHFGTTVLPLPLTRSVSHEDALAFAQQTAAGRQHGVVA